MNGMRRLLARLFGPRNSTPARRAGVILVLDLLEGRAVPAAVTTATEPSDTASTPALQAETDPGTTTGDALTPSAAPSGTSFPMPFGRPPFGFNGQPPTMGQFPGAPATGQNSQFPSLPDQLAGMDGFQPPTGEFPHFSGAPDAFAGAGFFPGFLGRPPMPPGTDGSDWQLPAEAGQLPDPESLPQLPDGASEPPELPELPEISGQPSQYPSFPIPFPLPESVPSAPESSTTEPEPEEPTTDQQA